MSSPPRQVTANGKTLTVPQWAKETGITDACINRRVHVMGWSWERAVSTPSMHHRYQKGEKFKNWTLVEDTGKRFGIGYCVWACVCDCGQAKEIPTNRFSPRSINGLPKCPKCQRRGVVKAHGKEMTYEEWSKETGLSATVIRSRIYNGWPPERAISAQKNPKYRFLTHNGEPLLMTQWAKRLGLTKEGLRQRLERMSVEEALSRPKRHFGKSNPIKIQIDGKSKTIREWSKISGLSRQAIYGRLKAGWEPKDAVFWKVPP